MKSAIEVLEIPRQELDALLEHARTALPDEDYRRLKAVVEGLSYLTELIADKDTTIRDLRRLLFPLLTEKTREVLRRAGVEAAEKPAADAETNSADGKQGKKPGHGRNGADAYHGAQRIAISHNELHAGDACPACIKGKIYVQQEPKRLVRISGQAPLGATVYELERLRCNLCGEVYTAPAPEDVGEEKYDETAAAMIAQMKYGSGMPFHRLERLEQNLGIPLPAATQWEIVEEAAELIRPVHEELIRQAAQGEVLHNDDTGMRVLHLAREPADERTGVFTSGVVSVADGRRIALFFTGRQHAGENLADVLKQRSAALPSPVQMCDALSRNTPKLPEGAEILLANCLAHGRRQFVEVAANFPAACRYVLEMLGEVYRNDAAARQQKMTSEERLRFHQQHSRPIMDKLHSWMESQLAERKTEPNSGLGQAVGYMLRHWQPLTLFLRRAGAPLDNNLVERSLKKAILHRKNALYYKTENGARVGDLYMSLIHTCELNGVYSLDYLTELQRHAEELRCNPAAWMPWNYRDALAQTAEL
ncbi:MAG TPA: IS66 family transposase [Acidobacteriaceae bacterium]|nr:IS66 family transposase [Acidobacteriaceae bacterium]